jgi:hypothetical protein
MKCISVRPPWSSYICPPDNCYGKSFTYHNTHLSLPKGCENRSHWPFRYTGPLLIHASKTYEVNAPKFLRLTAEEYPRGSIIGIVTLDAVAVDSTDPWYQQGNTALILKDNYTFGKHIPYRGQLGLFDVPDELVADEVALWKEWLGKRRKAG